MNIVPVIFEDHLLVRMRPAAWSTPVFEMRCGMFNTRERVELVGDMGQGVLLGRSFLRGLNSASGWSWGPDTLEDPGGPDSRFLFLNGLLAPDFSLIRDLCAGDLDRPCFVWKNGDGLVAALLGYDAAVQLAGHWQAWEEGNDRRGAWSDPASTPEPWVPEIFLPDMFGVRLGGGGEVRLQGPPATGAFDPSVYFNRLEKLQASGPGWIWNIVAATGPAIENDLAFVSTSRSFRREPFGIFPTADDSPPDWRGETSLRTLDSFWSPEQAARLEVDEPGRVYCAAGVELAGSTAINAAAGAVVIDRGVRVMPHCYLEGPLYIGPGSLVKPGARLHGDSSFGIVNRLAGEIAESTFGDFANKQHAGFIGHAVLGSWINLGALTTCSDLKNNYGEIRVDLGFGVVGTGSRFVGLMMGDHTKSAIGTMFNTGTSVGFASNIFGGGMPPKFVSNFQWGGQPGGPPYAVDRARETAAVVMSRRGCGFTGAHGLLFNKLGG